jgi:hypothetical protein
LLRRLRSDDVVRLACIGRAGAVAAVRIRESTKAIVGAAVTAAATLTATLVSDGELTRAELVAIVVAGVLGGLAVWAAPNAAPAPDPRADLPQRRRKTLQRDEVAERPVVRHRREDGDG